MRLLLDLNKSELGCLTLIKVSFYIITILRNISDNYIGTFSTVCYAFLQYFRDLLPVSRLELAILIPGCLLLGLAIRQRMRFFKQPGHKEPLGFSCFASVCCLPCSYGQMGAVELQTVWLWNIAKSLMINKLFTKCSFQHLSTWQEEQRLSTKYHSTFSENHPHAVRSWRTKSVPRISWGLLIERSS